MDASMHAYAFRYVSMQSKITEVETLMTESEETLEGCRRCVRKRCRISNFVPTLLYHAIAILFLILSTSVSWQPVAAFTASRSTISLGVYRNRINNNNSAKTPFNTTALGNNGVSDNEQNEVEATPTSSHRRTASDAPSFSIVRAIGAARTLSSFPVNRIRSWNEKFQTGYHRRVNGDSSFLGKSITEVLVAAGTQLMAEWNRRGSSRMVAELDFILPAVLTAVFGKYYSMWRTAKTLDDDGDDANNEHAASSKPTHDTGGDPILFGLPVPTNAFQPKMADGISTPTTNQRLGSFLAPVPALFKAGTIVSGVGYGIVSFLLALRTRMVPSYQTQTIPVNVLYASVYTGCFMAVVSNIRYQILQGLVEPILIDQWIFGGRKDVANDEGQVHGKEESKLEARHRLQLVLRPFLIFVVRWLNGLLGSVLAITGMRMCGLQRMKN